MESNYSQKPFIKKFKTDKYNYIYDVNSNEIIRVDPIIYDLIDEIGNNLSDQIVDKLKHLYNIQDILEKWKMLRRLKQEHNYFSSQKPEIFSGINTESDIKDIFSSNLNQVILELTERCCQRCKYCLFSGRYSLNRTHSQNDMPIDIAEKAMIFFTKKNSDPNNADYPPAVTFYGGEPLLNFDLLKHIVEFTKKEGVYEKYIFSFTTNGTLLEKEIIEYIVKNNISILISLDGPKEIHNRYRIFKNGEGTFDSVIFNLKQIKKYSKNYFFNNISFNAVISPPYDFDAIISFFYKRIFFEPFHDKIRLSFVDAYETTFFQDFHLENDKENLPHEMRKLRMRYEKALINGNYDGLTIEKNLFLKEYYNIAFRQIKPMGKYLPPRGTCVPGLRRLFVDTTGTFYMCEKVGSNYPIGDVEKGFDYKAIFEFYERYDRFFRDCKDCWAVRLCTKCFNNVRKGEELDTERKNMFCQNKSNNIEENLISYCRIIERKPDAFKFLEDVKIV